MLIHGESGAGKSRLADTVPAPRLILDAEGRAKYLPSGPKVYWNPLREAPPAYDGSWETCIVMVTDFNTLKSVFTWLRSGQHQFRSVVVDSLMEAQKRCIDAIAGVNIMKTQDWGTLLRELEGLMRDYRDLVLVPSTNVQCVVFTCGTRNQEGVMRPLVQGQLALTAPYFMDTVGYLYVQHTEGGGIVRNLLVSQMPGFVAKDGTDRLPGPVIENPNISELFHLLNGHDTTKEEQQ